jgi:hypothetical protein
MKVDAGHRLVRRATEFIVESIAVGCVFAWPRLSDWRVHDAHARRNDS